MRAKSYIVIRMSSVQTEVVWHQYEAEISWWSGLRPILLWESLHRSIATQLVERALCPRLPFSAFQVWSLIPSCFHYSNTECIS